MSGLVMPDPAKGPYHFDGCDFHPALWDVLRRDYKNCRFTNCDDCLDGKVLDGLLMSLAMQICDNCGKKAPKLAECVLAGKVLHFCDDLCGENYIAEHKSPIWRPTEG